MTVAIPPRLESRTAIRARPQPRPLVHVFDVLYEVMFIRELAFTSLTRPGAVPLVLRVTVRLIP